MAQRIYDLDQTGKNSKTKIIVTGSARLDIVRKMGDSLAGRHFNYRLNPFTLKELAQQKEQQISLTDLMTYGGFPEPFLEKDLNFYRKWQASHIDLILRQDLLDLEQVKIISKLETLVELLRHRVGSPCSYSSLATDLQVSYNTVKRWLSILENLFVIFRITPYSRNIARAILKTPKFYFYDIGKLPNDNGKRFENLTALALQSEIDFIKDTTGRKLQLHYLRNKDDNEIDFIVNEDEQILLALEAKWSEEKPEKSFKKFFENQKNRAAKYVQLVGTCETRREYDSGLLIEPAQHWLCNIDLSKSPITV